MTIPQMKQIATETLKAEGFEFDKLKAQTVSFSDLARGSAVFITAKGLRNVWPECNRAVHERFAEAKRVCKTSGFILEAF